MDERKTKLSDRLTESRQDLLASIAGVAMDDLAQRAVNDGWSIQDMLAHLASAERGHQMVLKTLLAGQNPRQPGFDLDAFNEAEVSARRGRTAEAVFSELAASRAETLALLDEVSPDDWDRSGFHPGGFDTNVEGVFRVIAIHERRHTKEIRIALSAA